VLRRALTVPQQACAYRVDRKLFDALIRVNSWSPTLSGCCCFPR
jgi:hypothetical protein